MKFSEKIWRKTSYIYENILALPFNKELADGSLDKSTFCYYIEQDAYYLLYFSKALALIAGRIDNPRIITDFLDFSKSALIVERDVIHSHYLKYELTGKLSFACFAYTNFLIAHAATSHIEVAIAAVLPCFWIYCEVGKFIFNNSLNADNPYKEWIETYASDEFSETVNKAISIMDGYAENANESIIIEMKKAFTYSCILEWHFWNDAYHKNTLVI